MTEIGRKPALFIGGLCLDLTIDIDRWPEDNEKLTARKQTRFPGGGATNAARAYRQLGLPCELLAPLGLDGLGDDFRKFLAHASIMLHQRDVVETPIAIVHPKNGDRSLIRGPDAAYLQPDKFPELDAGNFSRLHLDGKEPDAALYYAKAFRERGLEVSLDVNPRDNTDELLNSTTHAIASEKYYEKTGLSVEQLFDYFRYKGCIAGGITFGANGIEWFDGDKNGRVHAFKVDAKNVLDSSGAGDGFQGALLASRTLWPERSWERHIRFAAAVGAFMVQQFGNERFPMLEEVELFMRPRVAVANQ